MVISSDSMLNNNVEIDVNVLVSIINSQREQINNLEKSNHQLLEANQKLTAEVHLLNEKLDYFMNRQFGRSKESLTSDVSGQLSLFSDTFEELPTTLPKEEVTEVKGYKRKKGPKS